MCSRNNLLTAENRAWAPCIHRALQWAQQAVAADEATTAAQVHAGVRQRVADGGGRVDYVEVGPLLTNTHCVLSLVNIPTLLKMASCCCSGT